MATRLKRIHTAASELLLVLAAVSTACLFLFETMQWTPPLSGTYAHVVVKSVIVLWAVCVVRPGWQAMTCIGIQGAIELLLIAAIAMAPSPMTLILASTAYGCDVFVGLCAVYMLAVVGVPCVANTPEGWNEPVSVHAADRYILQVSAVIGCVAFIAVSLMFYTAAPSVRSGSSNHSLLKPNGFVRREWHRLTKISLPIARRLAGSESSTTQK